MLLFFSLIQVKIIPQEKERKDLEIFAAQICATHLHESHVEIRKNKTKREF